MKLPEGCSAARRYHRGKWSMVKMLSLSSRVRNLLEEKPIFTPSGTEKSFHLCIKAVVLKVGNPWGGRYYLGGSAKMEVVGLWHHAGKKWLSKFLPLHNAEIWWTP